MCLFQSVTNNYKVIHLTILSHMDEFFVNMNGISLAGEMILCQKKSMYCIVKEATGIGMPTNHCGLSFLLIPCIPHRQ